MTLFCECYDPYIDNAYFLNRVWVDLESQKVDKMQSFIEKPIQELINKPESADFTSDKTKVITINHPRMPA